MSKLIFLGTNSVLERYIEAAQAQGLEIAGIIDSDWYGNRDEFAGLPILDTQDNINQWTDYVFFIGTNWHPVAGRDIEKRQRMISLVREHNLTCVNLIERQTAISRDVVLGQGIYVGSHTTIESGTVIKDFVTIGNQVNVGHHSHLGENTNLQQKVGVHAHIGSNTYVGMGTVVFKNGMITIGDNVNIDPCLYVARDIVNGERITLDREKLRIYRRLNESI
jgi:serine acetyltransferase